MKRESSFLVSNSSKAQTAIALFIPSRVTTASLEYVTKGGHMTGEGAWHGRMHDGQGRV